jgi:AbrB family looped-hinge helix DNA binding protein
MTDTLTDMSYSVGTKGQVVIPKRIRDALRIHPGQEIVFELRGDEIVLRKSHREPLLGRFAGDELTDALLREREQDRERDDRRS